MAKIIHLLCQLADMVDEESIKEKACHVKCNEGAYFTVVNKT